MVSNEDLWNVVTNNATEDLKKLVFTEMKQNADLRNEYYRIKNDLVLLSNTKTIDQSRINKAYKEFNKELLSNKNYRLTPNLKAILYAAATVILILGISGLLYLFFFDSEPSRTLVSTANGQQATVLLPDSSTVTLSYGSSVGYDSNYGKKNRKVTLKGQAYFDVRKNSDLKMEVNTANLTIIVKGTTFDVSAYENDSETKVALYSGSLNLFQTAKESESYLLKPGDLAIYNNKTNKILINRDDLKQLSAWRDGLITFKNSDMSEVLKGLERKYNLKFILLDKSVLESTFTAKIKNDDYKSILKSIEFISKVKCEIKQTPDSVSKATIYISALK